MYQIWWFFPFNVRNSFNRDWSRLYPKVYDFEMWLIRFYSTCNFIDLITEQRKIVRKAVSLCQTDYINLCKTNASHKIVSIFSNQLCFYGVRKFWVKSWWQTFAGLYTGVTGVWLSMELFANVFINSRVDILSSVVYFI